jgi:hypothetical protein
MKTKPPNLLGAVIRDYFTDHLPRLRGTSTSESRWLCERNTSNLRRSKPSASPKTTCLALLVRSRGSADCHSL